MILATIQATIQDPTVPSSTSAHVLGFELDRVSDEQISTILKVAPRDVPARRKQLVAQHTDPAWIAGALDALPAATLAVLHLVIAHGGILVESEVFRAAKEQFAMAEDDVRAAATVALERLLLVPLSTSRGDLLFGAVHPAATLIAPLVAGLDALPAAASAFVPVDHVLRNPRTFLAICAATRHVDIKLTNEGRPHRTATKRLAKQVGIDDSVVEEVLGAGLATEVLRVDGEVLRPEPAALAEAAAGRYPFSPLVAAIRERLAAGPTAIRGLLHSLLRRRDLSASGYVGSDSFMFLPGFATGTIDGVTVVALREPAGVPSGHVTPSFEVMLPPESPLLDVVRVGACCDWERLDRAIVGRISKASVTRAIAAGASASELLAHLGAASRHPIPQNVEAAIRDWAGSVVAATIGRGYVVQVEPGARDRVATGMISLGARELAPGVFLIERETGLREIQTMLSRAGALHGEAAPPRPLPPPRAVAPASPAADRLRARVAAWRRNEPFEGKRDDFLERSRAMPGHALGSSADLAAMQAVENQLARWERSHGVSIPRDDPAYHALLGLLGSLPPAMRARILVSSHNLPELLRALSKVPVGPDGSGKLAPRARPPSRAARRPPPLLWQDEHLRERLERAAEDVEAIALDLPDRVRFVEIDRVLRRGKAWMVLGNDVTSGEAVAVQLDDIRAIAALPDNLEAYDLSSAAAPLADDGDDDDLAEDLDDEDLASERPRRPWHPAPGQAAPAGHVPCPCGSGSRYRNCCRDLPRA